MQETRKHFTQDYLIGEVRQKLSMWLSRHQVQADAPNGVSTVDAVMNAYAMFTLKSPSLLQFDAHCRSSDVFEKNVKQLFQVKKVLSDTAMRERVDRVPPESLRNCYTHLFALLQRGHVLDHYRHEKDNYLISLDGTGYFSSSNIHCENCCEKTHRSGGVTYYHQMLSAALVHPDQKVVYPLAPEPIMKEDGMEKNDCERNAAKRWLEKFRKEHPHLPTTIVADGLFSNEPFIKLLKEHRLDYILVCREGDHAYLMDWLNAADSKAAPYIRKEDNRVIAEYQYMNRVPLNSLHTTEVNVLRYTETKKKGSEKGKKTQWIWVTSFSLDANNVKTIMKGGRARWRIENETFNTLKNQGYAFEHNYGHGYRYLSTTLAYLMMLVFLVDQMLQSVNKRFCEALQALNTKRFLWEMMRAMIWMFPFDSFEGLYQFLHPPPKHRALPR